MIDEKTGKRENPCYRWGGGDVLWMPKNGVVGDEVGGFDNRDSQKEKNWGGGCMWCLIPREKKGKSRIRGTKAEVKAGKIFACGGRVTVKANGGATNNVER